MISEMLRKLFFFLLIITVSGTGGYFLAKNQFQNSQNQTFSALAMRLGQNGLINPLIDYEISQNIFVPETKIFDDKITKFTDSLINSGKANTISVYFRSLNNGPWFGINQDENYFPASLLKV